LLGIDAGTLYRFADNDGPELWRAEVGEAALEFSYRSAAA
jgi:hypothetical protein